jgi:hypothetical protein
MAHVESALTCAGEGPERQQMKLSDLAYLLGAAAVATGTLLASSARAEDCPICATSIVINGDLASCFLQKYGGDDAVAGNMVAVDLSRCEKSRSIVSALPTPTMAVEEPDTKFLLSRDQVHCLRDKLESDELVLDPSARIDLGSCG